MFDWRTVHKGPFRIGRAVGSNYGTLKLFYSKLFYSHGGNL